MHMITEWMPRVHLYTSRILYAGSDLALAKFLQDELEDCQVIRCPNGSQARLFIERINYSLLLFDEALPDATGRELACLTRGLAKRQCSLIIVVKMSDDFELLAGTIKRLLAAGYSRLAHSHAL
jgi:DNA-binding response OmpR family regulator